MHRLLLVVAFALTAAGCVTATVYGIVGDQDDLYTGSATGYVSRSGTIELSNTRGNRCKGDFAYYLGVLEGHGIIACDDGQQATIRFSGLSPLSGYGRGVSNTGRPVAFTYGMTREESARYLGLQASAAGAPAAPGASAPARGGTGTGFYVSRQGHVLTNAHVAGKCTEITVTRQNGAPVAASLVKADEANDLAVLVTPPSPSVASFRSGRPVRAGENVVAYGFPLTGMLASGGTVTNGSISALSGLADDSRYYQISAPVQPGNSGGPLLDTSGNVVGVVTASLGGRFARRTGTLPQNVNFALKADVARTFLESAGIPIETSPGGRELSVADIGEKARAFTVLVDCKR